MSSPLFKQDILFTQRILTVAGFYKGQRDGKWNTGCDAAEADFDAESRRIAAEVGTFDPRSEANILTLLPVAQKKCREFMDVVSRWPFGQVKILSGTRTYAEQNALYALGRTKPGRIVTKARGGFSNHNFGIAWDVGIFVGGVYYEGKAAKEDRAYDDLAAYVKNGVSGLAWGGDWKSIVDKPHYQLVAGNDVRRCRAMLEEGKAYA
jgi:peptidoglycan L-alanyl-D-glutamate endopeptidase CwlK